MMRTVGTFTKGIATGIVVGTAVGMIGQPMLNPRRRTHAKKNAAKALRAVGELVQNVQYMMR